MSFWNQRYLEEGYAYGLEPNQFLKEHAGLIKPKGRVLCLGEGEGRNAVYLAKLGYQVDSVDLSEIGMQKAKTLAAKEGVQISYEVADLADYMIAPKTYDAIVSIWTHVPSSLRVELHKKVVNGLKEGGIVLLEAYNKDQINLQTGGPKDIDLLFDLEELKKDFQALTLTHTDSFSKMVFEGKYHQGLSSVVDLIAKKL